jgi:ribosomal protein L37AE/L43A
MKIAKDMPPRRWCPTCRAKQVFTDLADYTLRCPNCQTVFTGAALRKAAKDENDRLLGLKG